MPKHKSTKNLSEIGKYFTKNDASSAMFNILRTINSLRLPEKVLFGRKSKCNQLYSFLNVFVCLPIGPCFMIRNPYNYEGSPLSGLMGCKKDVFYGFLRDARINWRKLMYHVNVQLWTRMEVRSDHKERTTCLMVDDTDFPKTGKRMERIGRVHSHLEHRSILGFKALFLGITDGVSQMLLDFALVGEKGSKKNYGMSQEELDARYAPERDKDDAVGERLAEYDKDKITLAMDMVRTAIKSGIRFQYLLADSWFICKEIIRFIHSRHIKCHYLGCIKVGEKGKTKYGFGRKDFTAPALIKHLNKKGTKKYSRKLRCWYITADVTFAGVSCRMFFIRRSKHGAWSGLITTNTRLDFFEAYRIYAQRWSLEVVFKESKGLLGMGKCQARDFAEQIAHTSIVSLQYNILSVVKRFNDYETIGGLFREVEKDSLELTIAERIWEIVMETVITIANLFGLTDEEVLEVAVCRSDELAHICRTFKLKVA